MKSRYSLVQVIIGVGINRTVFRIGRDIAQLIVGIAEAGSVRKAGVAQAAYLGSGLGIVNIPVGVALSVDIPGGDGRKAAMTTPQSPAVTAPLTRGAFGADGNRAFCALF